MGYKGDGVERPFLDKQGHSAECRVWESFEQRFNCTCGAAQPPEPRIIPGFSDYELATDGTVRQISLNRTLQVSNIRRTVNLRGDDGVSTTRSVKRLIEEVFRYVS